MITTERVGAIAVLRLAGPKANAMTPAFLDALDAALAALEASGARGAVIIGTGRTFGAGLALPDLVGLDRGAMRAFMQRFEAVMVRALACPVALVAAVNGFAIAGGCVLALMCDDRVMADVDATIGLSEIRLGIGLPASVVEVLRLRVAHATAVELALGGALHRPADALRLGLVREVVPADALLQVAVDRAGALGGAAALARAQIKAALLRPTLDVIAREAPLELERWLDTWFSPDGQARVREAVARLRR